MTIKASSDKAVESGMAEGLKILARMIATAHRQRVAEGDGNQRQPEGSHAKKVKREESPDHKQR